MRWLFLCLALAGLLSGTRASAQQTFLSSEESASLQADLQEGNVSAATIWLNQVCGPLLEESTSGRDVSERAETAREALHCAKQVAAAATALAQPSNSFQVRGLVNTSVDAYEENLAERESEEAFLGFNWGIGLGFSVPIGGSTVNDAAIVNGTVRVNAEQAEQPRAFLEYHKYFWCADSDQPGTQGCGPFVSAVATDNKVLAGVGAGLMFGKKTSASDTDGFSLGVGVVLDADVKDLGEGFGRNQAPPTGETAVRFETRSRWSIVAFITRTF
jgi:hypothetical protein